jgi:predicted amidophosphoribosyltransferase
MALHVRKIDNPWDRFSGVRVPAMYIVDYHPVQGGNNPKFDDVSAKVLEFKEGKAEAVNYFTDLVKANFDPDWNDCYCVSVPSHSSGNISSPIHDLIKRLAGFNGLKDASGVLVRTETIAKLAHGGNRAIKNHLNSIAINKNCGVDISGKKVLLIDDVLTTGNSLAACKRILHEGGADKVFVLALSNTSFDSDEDSE